MADGLETTVNEMPPFIRYQGGKSRIAKQIAGMLPPHEKYVEPMVGGGSVYFAKDPAPKEVISDLDGDLMNFYRALKKGNIKRCDLSPSEKKFYKIRDKKNRGSKLEPCEKLYLQQIGFGGYGQAFDHHKLNVCNGKDARKCSIKSKDQDKYANRLKNTLIEKGDYEKIIKKHDSKNTVIYLDPPYAETDVGGYKHNALQPEDVKKVVDRIKGKFLLSYNNSPRIRKLFCGRSGKKYKCREINTTYTLNNTGKKLKKTELIITNFLKTPIVRCPVKRDKSK